jgi:squalene-associated FAD-dependent desaturase
MPHAIHVIGAGLAGLSAAVRLAGRGERVIVHEAAPHAGGRCRSYHDATLDMVIDNGNHLVLSGNDAVLDYLRTLGAEHRLVGPATTEFHFVDLRTAKRWTLRPNPGRLPWWVLDRRRRIPGTRAFDYLPAAKLLRAGPQQRIGDVIACRGAVYERLLRPVLLAALNTEPRDAAAALAGAVIRETLATGGAACRPLIARDGLGAAFIEPAVEYLSARGSATRFGHRLRAIGFADARAQSLDFGEDTIALGSHDAVVLAVPPPVAAALVPGLTVPTEFCAIVNAHFRIAPPADLPPMIGVINGTVEWIFAFPDRLSITISGADRLLETPRDELAALIWKEVAAVAKLMAAMPPWQIVRERRATFAATPAQNARRPGARTAWANLVLAGDWTATGLPATIEGAIRSGNTAADITRANYDISAA